MFCPFSNLIFLLSMNQCTILFIKFFTCWFMNLANNQRTILITINMGELKTSNTIRNTSTLKSTMLSAVMALRHLCFIVSFLSIIRHRIRSSSKDLSIYHPKTCKDELCILSKVLQISLSKTKSTLSLL